MYEEDDEEDEGGWDAPNTWLNIWAGTRILLNFMTTGSLKSVEMVLNIMPGWI